MAWVLSVDQCRNVLQSRAKDITDLTDFNYLIPILCSKGLITENKFKEMPAHERSRLFHNILVRRPSALHLFIEALQEEEHHSGHKHLARKLLEEVSKIKSSEATSESESIKQLPADSRNLMDTRSKSLSSRPKVHPRRPQPQRSQSESKLQPERSSNTFETRDSQEMVRFKPNTIGGVGS